jgi:hypothetical protein
MAWEEAVFFGVLAALNPELPMSAFVLKARNGLLAVGS